MIKAVRKYPETPISGFIKSMNRLVAEKNDSIIHELTNQNNCNHRWQQHGHGYHCLFCGFYTGMNGKMNKIIKRAIAKIKP